METPVDAVDMGNALDYVEESVINNTAPKVILAVNPEKVYILRDDSFLKTFFEKAALLIPDGIGIVKAMKILNNINLSRCPGADLMQEICRLSAQKGYRIFIYGGSEQVNLKACRILQERYLGIRIVGRANGYMKEEDMHDLINDINASEADILFVALGSPRQEQWMNTYLNQLTTIRICQGIGGTLDTIAGTVKRAPITFQKMNLEWFYRLLCQPKRFKRQLRCFKFAVEVFKCKLTM